MKNRVLSSLLAFGLLLGTAEASMAATRRTSHRHHRATAKHRRHVATARRVGVGAAGGAAIGALAGGGKGAAIGGIAGAGAGALYDSHKKSQGK